jgi:hypothetical protein
MPRKQSQKQRQKKPQSVKQTMPPKQTESVKQTVIVKVGEQPVIKRRSSRYRRSRRPKATEPQYAQAGPLPPNVIYQSTQYIPPQFTPEPTRKITEPEPKKATLADVGVGTEGFVKIIDLPTKKEQLDIMTAPVALKPPQNIPMEEYIGIERVKSAESRPSAFSEEDVPSKFMQPSSGSFAGSSKPVELPITNKDIGMEIMKPSPMDLTRQQDAISAQEAKLAQFDNTDYDTPITPIKKPVRRVRAPLSDAQKARNRERARQYRARIKAGNTGRLQG